MIYASNARYFINDKNSLDVVLLFIVKSGHFFADMFSTDINFTIILLEFTYFFNKYKKVIQKNNPGELSANKP